MQPPLYQTNVEIKPVNGFPSEEDIVQWAERHEVIARRWRDTDTWRLAAYDNSNFFYFGRYLEKKICEATMLASVL